MLKSIGLGLGLALGGGIAYMFATNEAARLFIIAFIGFILGAGIVGFFIVYAIRSQAQAFAGKSSTFNDRRTVFLGGESQQQPHPSPWGSMPALPPGAPAHQMPAPQVNQWGGQETVVEPANSSGDVFVA